MYGELGLLVTWEKTQSKVKTTCFSLVLHGRNSRLLSKMMDEIFQINPWYPNHKFNYPLTHGCMGRLKKNSVAVYELSDCPLSAKLVPTFAGRGVLRGQCNEFTRQLISVFYTRAATFSFK
jgi:hypothetical protein